jgi:hypothetical protein
VAELDPKTPSIARICDYFAGGLSGPSASASSLLCSANDQIGEIVTEPRWGLAVVIAAWRFIPAASLRREGVQELVQLRVDVAIRVGVIVRSYEQDARSVWGLECDYDPQRSAQVLDAHAADWDRARQPISERRTAVAREVINKGREDERMRSVEVTCLLLSAPCSDYLDSHTYYFMCYIGPPLASGRRTTTLPRSSWSILSRRSARSRSA